MSDPTFSDIAFKNKMAWVWTTLKNGRQHPEMVITVNFGDKVKWGASSRWSLLPNSAWSIIETRTITKTHPTLDIGHFHDLFSEKAKEIICAEEKNKEASRAQTCRTRSGSRHWKPSRESIGLGNKTNLYWCQRPGLISDQVWGPTFSRCWSSLYCLMRISDEMTIREMHPTLQPCKV